MIMAVAEKEKEAVTNENFANQIGVHFTMASKLRNGHRMPSIPTLIRIWQAYGLDGNELLAAASQGEESFGRFLRSRIFED